MKLFLARGQAYKQVPDYYRARLYMDTLAVGRSQLPRKFIVPDDTEVRLDAESAESAARSLLGDE